MSDMNLLKTVEQIVFWVVDTQLRAAETYKPEEFLPVYDVICVQSMQFGEFWWGTFKTTIDEFHYKVTYQTDTKVAQIMVLKEVAEFFIPEGQLAPAADKSFWK